MQLIASRRKAQEWNAFLNVQMLTDMAIATPGQTSNKITEGRDGVLTFIQKKARVLELLWSIYILALISCCWF